MPLRFVWVVPMSLNSTSCLVHCHQVRQGLRDSSQHLSGCLSFVRSCGAPDRLQFNWGFTLPQAQLAFWLRLIPVGFSFMSLSLFCLLYLSIFKGQRSLVLWCIGDLRSCHGLRFCWTLDHVFNNSRLFLSLTLVLEFV